MKTDSPERTGAAATCRLATCLPLLGALLLMSCADAADHVALPDSAPTQLVVVEIAAGNGRELLRNEYLVVHYEGWIWDESAPAHKGRRFDSSRERGRPLSLLYRPTRMIEGWYRGIKGMKAGGRRVLVIPPDLGYGARTAFGEIPPESTLIFDIELLDVVSAQAE